MPIAEAPTYTIGCPKCGSTCALMGQCNICASKELCPKCREEVTGVKLKVGEFYRRKSWR
jgi:hypothetical protein